MHADDFRLDRYGVVSGLRDGGYSDDMTLAAIAGNVLISSYLFKFDQWNWKQPVYRCPSTNHNLTLTLPMLSTFSFAVSSQGLIRGSLHLLQLLFFLILLQVISVLEGL